MKITQLDHTAYRRKVKKMTEDQLRFTIKDAREAAEAMPFGPKAGYYWDEVHYCAAELKRRFRGKQPMFD